MLDCTVRDMTTDGISVTPSFGGTVVIADTTVSNNSVDGIFTAASGSGVLTITLSHVKAINSGFNGSGFGVRLTGLFASFLFATIDSTLIAENGSGLALSASTSNVVTAFVINSNVVNNANSITVGASTGIQIEKTSVVTYFGGVITNNRTITSFGDNAILDKVTGNGIQPRSLQ
ncbi:MAG: hypothetical protein ACREDT_11015 [Methylocella sp.]